jgi:2-polyprenyl-3-methyl-5-hydroxy-6-metoxy-1,4-benzoquinol methylase
MQLYYQSYGTTHPRDLEISEKQMEYAKEITQQFHKTERPLRFLDIGAASGEIMKAFEKQGWEVYGIELSESFLQFAKEKRNLKNIYSCEIEDAPFEDNSFDFIHFWHVIEHLRDPIIVLKKIYNWLQPNGRVNIGTPNPRPPYVSLTSLVTNRFDLGIDHTFGFPPKVFEDILTRYRLHICEHKVYNKPEKKYASAKAELMKRNGTI